MFRCFVGIISTFCIVSSLLAAADEPPVAISSPIDGAVIFQPKLLVSGAATDATRVAILVQGMTKGSAWKVTDLVSPETDGSFRSTIEFSDARYDIGYRIIAVGARGSYAMRTMRPGTILRQPPTAFQHSKMIRVTLAGSARPGGRRDALTDQILMPVDGSLVGPTETVVIEGKGDPLPVVLIRPNEKGGQWYVQQEVKPIGQGRTAVEVRFGGKLAAQGDRFQLCLAIPKTPQQRAEMRNAKSFADIPASIPHGTPIVVKLSLKKLPTVDLAKLLFEKSVDSNGDSVRLMGPANGTLVSRRPLVTGRFDPKMLPVLLVRTELDQGTWYVQPPCEVNGGMFSNKVYLGKLGTPQGTRFQIIAILVPPQDAGKWKSGRAVTDLPQDFPISKPLLVVHNGSDE